MPKGIYKRTKQAWNKGIKGAEYLSHFKDKHFGKKGRIDDPIINSRARELFLGYVPGKECDKLLYDEFGIKMRARTFWKRLFSKEEIAEHRHRLSSENKQGNKNPMKSAKARENSSLSHKGCDPWNKGKKGQEYLKHYPNGIKGGPKKDYHPTIKSRLKMSESRKRLFAEGKLKFIPSEQMRQKSRERMIKNRQNQEFNKKMFSSFNKSVTKPHRIVKEIIEKQTNLKTQTNLCYRFGSRDGSIDEADNINKIAIFIDGDYWHKYPEGRRWDKYCTTYLQNKGWIVLRFWEHDIKGNIEDIKKRLVEVAQNAQK